MVKRIDVIFSSLDMASVLKKASAMASEEMISLIKDSELRGRGGAGFYTGLKWELASQAPCDAGARYFICDADEGEPGTFKDKKILQDVPEKVFAGMIIGAHAVGAKYGYVYLRGEYTYLRPLLEKTIQSLIQAGWIRGRENSSEKAVFDFSIEIRMGSGAYVCGEETSLIESLEGKRGEPRNKPPYPVEKGLFGQPTVVNNVETLSLVPHIVHEGSDWFHQFGTSASVGSKLFSVSGDCARPGIYEFEFGITVRELLKEVGEKGNTKAVQIGGASGFCASREDFDKTIAFEGIPTGGSILVLGQETDMFRVLKNFMEFFWRESCGQCTPCREGTSRLLEGLNRFERGKGSSQLLRNMLRLANTMKLTSKCGLGQSIPNSFISIVSRFEDEIISFRSSS